MRSLITILSVLRSVAFLSQLLSASHLLDPQWVSWVAHARLAVFVLRREYSESDGEVLDAMVYDYLRKYTTAYG